MMLTVLRMILRRRTRRSDKVRGTWPIILGSMLDLSRPY